MLVVMMLLNGSDNLFFPRFMFNDYWLFSLPWCIPFENCALLVPEVQRKAWGFMFRYFAYVIGLSDIYYWSLL